MNINESACVKITSASHVLASPCAPPCHGANRQRFSMRASFHIGHHQWGEHEAAVLSLCHLPLLSLSTQAMSQTRPSASSSSSSNFQSVLNAALDAYEKKTKNKLLTHPLAAQFQSCDFPTAILSVLQDLIEQFDRRRRSDERLTKWLNPTVNVLYAFLSTISQGVGLVSL